MAGDLMKWAIELKDKLKMGGVNSHDIAMARREANDTAARQEAAGCGLVAMPAGTWTPSMDWYGSVKHLQYVVAKFKEETPGDDHLAELEELAMKLNAVADGEADAV
jgi:hypothetical protein